MNDADGLSVERNWVHRAIEWLRERDRARRNAEELALMTPAELQLMADDLKIDANDLIAIAGSDPHTGELLDKMLHLHGLDHEVLAAETRGVLKDLQVTCSRCGEQHRCAHDMANGTPVEALDVYCPNAPTMAALRNAAI